MKFAVFVLIAGLCLAAVTANVETIDDFDIEFLSQYQNDDSVPVETQGLFTGIYWLTKGALKTLKGINCAIQVAIQMQEAALQFTKDAQSCGGIIPAQVQTVINNCNNVITDVNNLINVNDTICNNADGSSTSTKTSSKCFWKILKQFLTLKNDIQKTLKAIKKIPSTGPDTGDCFVTAANTLADEFNSYPAFMKSCSKLTSN